MSKSKIYCVFCGELNEAKNKKCNSCKKKLNSKENLFVDYIIDHGKDDLEGKVEEGIITGLTNYIKKHLYGVIMTMSILITGTTLVVSSIDSFLQYDKVTRPPVAISNGYIGAGLEPNELLELYINLLQNEKDELASSIHLYTVEGFEKTLESFPLYRGRKEFVEIYKENPVIKFSNEIINENSVFGNYTFSYCGKSLCADNDKKIRFSIEFSLYLKDNNWYIISENIFYESIDLTVDPNTDLKGALNSLKK